MNCYIVYEKYYDFENKSVLSGGIQTYLSNLIPILCSSGYKCILYQMGTEDCNIKLENVDVYSIKTDFSRDWRDNSRTLVECFEDSFNDAEDLLLFATDMLICKNNASKSIAIQHGVCWDIPNHTHFPPKMNSLYVYRKVKQSYNIVNCINNVKKIVCVDYNFPNWYRAVSAYEAVPLEVIPNFAELASQYEKPVSPINIIFSRRFEWYRGTRIFAEAIGKILNEYNYIHVTVAGRGPDGEYLKNVLANWNEKVTFTQYTSNESLTVHSNQHIAIIPTVGSEGTSLSLLEAMSAQCAVVCTNVGGMTNIVIDGYNGLMVNAGNVEQLYLAIKKLIDDQNLRNRLSKNAYDTVKYGFNIDIWRERWRKVIEDTIR